jgi:hypothetical protein
MNKKILCDRSGFSLVEVMVATAISIGMFLFLNQSLLTLKKTQIKMERRSELIQIFPFLEQHLGDLRAWQDGPEGDVPLRGNNVNFYYYAHRKAAIAQLSYTESEFQLFNKEYKCPSDMPKCRLILFTYQGEVLQPGQFKSLPNNYLMAQIGFVTEDQEISRLYLPELKLLLSDTEDDNELRLPDKLRSLNALQTQESRSELTIDPIMRSKCFNMLADKYPGTASMALELCGRISSTMPAQCFIQMKEDLKASDIVAQVVCTKALSPRPIECFKEGRSRFSVDEALVAISCSGATSFAPLDCLDVINSKAAGLMEGTAPYKVCARAQDSSPGECLIALYEKSADRLDQALSLCPHHK